MNFFQKRNLLPVALAILAVVIALGYVIPTVIELFKLNSEFAAKKERVLKLRKKVDSLESLDKTAIKEDAGKLGYYLPPSKDVSILLNTITELTSDTGLFFENLSLSPGEISTESAVKVSSDLPSMDVSLSFSGNIPDLLKLLSKVDKVSPVIRIKNLDIQKKSKVSEVGVPLDYKITAVVTTYYKPLPKTLGDLASEVKELTPVEKAFVDSLPNIVKSSLYSEEKGIPFQGGRTDPFSKF